MKMLIINPDERFFDTLPGFDGEIERICAMVKNLNGYLDHVEVAMAPGAKMPPKLHRTLLGEGNQREGRTVSVVYTYALAGTDGSVFKVPEPKKRPKTDWRLLSTLTEGSDDILVMGWSSEGIVKPSVLDLAGSLGNKEWGRIVIISNCIGGQNVVADWIEDFAQAGDFKVMTTSQATKMAWGEQ